MCGIAGFVDCRGCRGAKELEKIVEDMASTLGHRGPDDDGTWVDEKVGIALGHCRLSIIDLSDAGHQPMVSESGRYVITYNGEVYNFPELREKMKSVGYKFKGYSDTETVLATIEKWGEEEAVKKFVGMFAFAVWDRRKRKLTLVRDRLGIKPLYYGLIDRDFVFASELKAFHQHPKWNSPLNRKSLALFMRYNYIPGPHSIYKNIYKLYPGSVLTLGIDQLRRGSSFDPNPGAESDDAHTVQPRQYWSMHEIGLKRYTDPFDGSDEEAEDELEDILRDAVSCRMISDVPLGAYLSGGIDSSLVVAIMQSFSATAVKTFTIGFYDQVYNEAPYARAVARYLGTEHTELYVTPEESMAVICELPCLYDEPFADSSQIPTFLVSKLASQRVKVSLSGDGGDENFGGYNNYFLAANIWRKVGWLPQFVRRCFGKLMKGISLNKWDNFCHFGNRFLPTDLQKRLSGDRVYKMADIIGAKTPDMLYMNLISHWKHVNLILGVEEELAAFDDDPGERLRDHEFIRRMMYTDMNRYLPDDILVKLDRASMAVSLEARVPILDHRVVEFAARLPLVMLIKGETGKHILRRVLCRYIPTNLIERPKKGFSLPIGSWLRGPLRDWAESLLDESRLRRELFLNPAPIRKKWEEHLSGKRDWKSDLWSVLMFQSWLDANR